MSDVNELLGYNRHGLRYMTPKDMRELRKRVASHDWAPDLKKTKPTLISRIALHLSKTITKS